MMYSERLRKLFGELTLHGEDLLLLESFQIKYLPDRVPQLEFATILRNYPVIHRFLISKYPPIEGFIANVIKENKEITDPELVNQYCDELLWEIADLIVYNKYPELYDRKLDFRWDINKIISVKNLKDLIVLDVGSGSGKLAFLLANYAKIVYAVEPLGSFRDFIRKKICDEKVSNVFVLDGFLDSLPFPGNSIDILFTSNAIGWSFENELLEIERVLKPNGQAIHLMRGIGNDDENPFHEKLSSPEWNYDCTKYPDTIGLKFKYVKTLNGSE